MTQNKLTTTPAADAAGFDKLTKAQVAALQKDMAAVLGAVGAKYGLKLTKNSASWTPEGVKVSLQLDKVTADGGNAKLVANWARYAQMDGLPADGIGRTFVGGGKTYRVMGYDAKRRTRPVVTSGSDGKTYVFASDIVAKLLGGAR